jgi:hypothetical protein
MTTRHNAFDFPFPSLAKAPRLLAALWAILPFLACCAGCAPGAPRASAEGQAYLLHEQPQGALSVLDLKQLLAAEQVTGAADKGTAALGAAEAAETVDNGAADHGEGGRGTRSDGEPAELRKKEVVFIARVGGGEIEAWDPYQAVFLVRDLSLEQNNSHAHSGHDDNCKFCQEEKKRAIEAMAQVQIVDENGAVVPSDARQLLGLRENQVIVARGTATLDAQGTLVVSARQIFIR